MKINTKTIGIASILLLVLYVFVLLTQGTSTFADVMRGYEMMFQFKDGADWNTLNYPSAANPEQSYFVAWWAPGQWMIPYFLFCVAGISSFQVVQALLIIICLLCSMYGYKKLFEKIGFTPLVIALTLLSIISNQLFYWHTLLFYGGDLFLLALLPYFALLLIHCGEKFTIGSCVLFFAATLLGLFFKNTFLIIAFSGIFFLFFAPKKIGLKQRINSVLPYMIGLLVLFLLLNKSYFSLGETPGSAIDTVGYNGVKNSFVGDIAYALGHPIGIFSRLTFIVQKLLHNNLFQLLPLALTCWFFASYGKKGQRKYFDLLVWWAGPFSLFFMVMYLQDKAISYEMRHFAPFAFLFFPGIIDWILSSRFKKIGMACILCFCLADLVMGVMSFRKINATQSSWNDLKVDNKDHALLTAIASWDKQTAQGCLLMDTYWMPSIAVRKNDKWILKKRGNSYEVISGMELDHPKMLEQIPVKKYAKLLLISSRDNPSFDPADFLEFKAVSKKTIDGWEITQLERTKNKLDQAQ